MNGPHVIERVRHSPRFRLMEVRRIETPTPRTIRIVFGGDLQGFHSAAHDDHVKMFFPAAGEDKIPMPEITPEGTRFPDGSRPATRDFTPRRFDLVAGELTVDFALHDAGPATAWAARARPGHVVGIGGPRSSFVVADDFDWYLFVADETGVPAVARRLEELRPGVAAHVCVEVEDSGEEIVFSSRADLSIAFVRRNGALPIDFDGLSEALARFEAPAGDGYTWIACESRNARRLRSELIIRLGLNPKWVKAAGYWKAGQAAVHERFED